MAAGDYPAGPPPKEAVDYLRHKGVRAGYDYREIWREEHAISFTVANMMKLDMLEDVQASITKALEEGWPAERWKKEMAAEMAKRGWWGRRGPPDPNDPKDAAGAKRYTSRRLDIIWRVNTRQAAQAGVWERGTRSTSHPYILYRVGPSKRHRDQHLAWDGLVLPKQAEFWRYANPMNGWGCKCYTRFVSRAQYERYKRNGIPAPAAGDGTPGKKPVVTEEPRLQPREYTNPVNGRDYVGYEGIDDGFEHNPGVGRMEQLTQQHREKVARALPPVAPAQPTAQRPDLKPVGDSLKKMEIEDPDVRRKTEAGIATVAKAHNVEGLPRIPVGETDRFDEGSIGWTITPDGGITAESININPAGWRPDWIVVHEIGHFLDIDALGSKEFASEEKNKPSGARDARSWELVQAVIRQIKRTENYQRLLTAQEAAAKRGDKEMSSHLRYYVLTRRELFARAYAQYIAWRSDDATLFKRLDAVLMNHDPLFRLRQWPYAQFLPIVERFDTLFESLGWLTRPKNT